MGRWYLDENFFFLTEKFYLMSVYGSYKKLGFPCGSAGKESACNAGDLSSLPGLGRYSGEEKGYPLQYSGLENFMDSIVHGVTKSWTWLSDFHYKKLFIIRIMYNLFSRCVHVWSVVSNSLRLHGLQPARLLCPWNFPGKEYWSGLPFPSPGDLPNPGIKTYSPENL